MDKFNSKLKKEICKNVNPSHALSFLSALIKTCGELAKNGKQEQIIIRTEVVEAYDAVSKILQSVYGTSAELVISDDVRYLDRPKYEILLPENLTTQLLIDTEVAFYDEQKYLALNGGISKYIIETNEQLAEYIKGVYIGCGTSNIVLRQGDNYSKNTGYKLEFVLKEQLLASDFASALASVNIISKTLKRKDAFVVYVQDFEQVSTLIALMGASKCFLDIQNENALRDMRNTLNRQTNCQTANISKIVSASLEQLSNIKTIQETIGIESLDEQLRQACYLRLANPDESLDNLVKLSTNKISKSGLYHRFQKINKIAKEILA